MVDSLAAMVIINRDWGAEQGGSKDETQRDVGFHIRSTQPTTLKTRQKINERRVHRKGKTNYGPTMPTMWPRKSTYR